MDLQALRPAVLEQPRPGIELERRRAARGADARLGAGLHDEAAADAVILLFGQYLQRRVVRREAHAVGMPGQHLIQVKQQIERLVEGDLVPAQQADPACDANSVQSRLHGGSIDGVGTEALQAQQDGPVGAMAAAGEREGAVELSGYLDRTIEQITGREQLDEAARRVHRTHGMRARWADADLENIEDAQTHAFIPWASQRPIHTPPAQTRLGNRVPASARMRRQ